MDNPFVQPDPGLFIWTIVTFLVLLALLAKFAWRPLLQALETRQDAIRKSLDDAAAGASRSWSGCMSSRPRSSSGRVSTPSRSSRRAGPTATGCARRLKQKARAEADTSSRTRSARFSSRRAARCEQIRHEAIDLSVIIASKIIQRNLTKEDNERLIDDALKQVETRRHYDAPRRSRRCRRRSAAMCCSRSSHLKLIQPISWILRRRSRLARRACDCKPLPD